MHKTSHYKLKHITIWFCFSICPYCIKLTSVMTNEPTLFPSWRQVTGCLPPMTSIMYELYVFCEYLCNKTPFLRATCPSILIPTKIRANTVWRCRSKMWSLKNASPLDNSVQWQACTHNCSWSSLIAIIRISEYFICVKAKH